MGDLARLDVETANPIAALTMSAPPVNALTRALNNELKLAFDRISEMDEMRVVILPGRARRCMRART